jgi:PhnB protein
MPNQVKPIPEDYCAITPFLMVHDAAAAIAFYQRAFGAKEILRMEGPGGKIAHAELKIGGGKIMLADETQGTGMKSPRSAGLATASVFMYVEDVDAVFNQAAAAGAHVDQAVTDMFWGDRYGRLTDPFGQIWSLATHKEDVSREEMQRRGREAMAKAPQTRTAS